jgi:hypothetical protein
MQSPKRYLETISNDNEYDLPDPKSPGEFADRFGIRASLLILCVGLFIAALWMVSRPSFEKCLSAIAKVLLIPAFSFQASDSEPAMILAKQRPKFPAALHEPLAKPLLEPDR